VCYSYSLLQTLKFSPLRVLFLYLRQIQLTFSYSGFETGWFEMPGMIDLLALI